MESKHIRDGIIAIAVALGFWGMFHSISNVTSEKIEFAKAGLEECPKEPGSRFTLWVKSCDNYIKNYYPVLEVKK